MEDSKARVFISYSRQDKALVSSLHRDLIARGYDAFLDSHDIAPGEEWQLRLDRLIVSADAVVFVITDASLASEVCEWEVNRTLVLGKRMLPLVHGPHQAKAPPGLAALNYIFSDDPGSGATAPYRASASALDKLSAAIDVDIIWVREHSRLVGRAEEWGAEAERARHGKLLRSPEIMAARVWEAARPKRGAPEIPTRLREYLAASDAHEKSVSARADTITGRAFVTPVAEMLSAGRFDAALRRAGAGMVLSNHSQSAHVPELAIAASLAASECQLHTVCPGRASQAWFIHGGDVALTFLDHPARIWDVDRGRLKHELAFDEHQGRLLALSPDLQQAVTANGGRVNVWGLSGLVFNSDWERSPTEKRAPYDGRANEVRRVTAFTQPGQVSRAVFHPGGSAFVTASDFEGAVVMCDPSGVPRELSGAERPEVYDLAYSAGGNFIIVAHRDHTASLRREIGGREMAVLRGHSGPVTLARFGDTGRYILTVSEDATARLWMAPAPVRSTHKSRKRAPNLKTHRVVRDVSFALLSPGEEMLLILPASSNQLLRIEDTKSGRVLSMLKGHAREISSAAFSPDGLRVVSGSHDGTVRVWDANTGEEMSCMLGHEAGVESVAFSLDGKLILSRCGDEKVRIWRAAATPEIAVLQAHPSGAGGADFSDSGERLYSVGANCLRVWNAGKFQSIGRMAWKKRRGLPAPRRIGGDGTPVRTMRVLKNGYGLHAAAFAVLDPAGRRVVAVADDKAAYLWDASTYKRITRLGDASDCDVNSAMFSADSRYIVAACDDRKVRIWDAATGREHRALVGHEDAVRHAAFSSSGKLIVSASYDRTARLWEAVSGREISIVLRHERRLRFASFSPDDGKVIIVAEFDAQLFDIGSGSKIAVFKNTERVTKSAAFSPDGQALLLLTSGGEAKLHATSDGREICALRGLSAEAVFARTFSNDGGRVVGASTDNSARIWDAESGREIAVLRGHTAAVVQAKFCPDGERVVTASSDGSIRVWDVRRTTALTGSSPEVVAAFLTRGRGSRTRLEADDLLLKDLDKYDVDIGALLRETLMANDQRSDARIIARLATLDEPLHPNCYTVPSQRTYR